MQSTHEEEVMLNLTIKLNLLHQENSYVTISVLYLLKGQNIFAPLWSYRSRSQRYSIKKVILKNFAIFTRKHLCRNFFLIKLQVSKSAALSKRDSITCFFLWILRNLLEHLFRNHLRKTASGVIRKMLFRFSSEAYSEPSQTFKMELFAKIVNS